MLKVTTITNTGHEIKQKTYYVKEDVFEYIRILSQKLYLFELPEKMNVKYSPDYVSICIPINEIYNINIKIEIINSIAIDKTFELFPNYVQ